MKLTLTLILSPRGEDFEYKGSAPKWVYDKGLGQAMIGEPVGCTKCHAWGTGNFEEF